MVLQLVTLGKRSFSNGRQTNEWNAIKEFAENIIRCNNAIRIQENCRKNCPVCYS